MITSSAQKPSRPAHRRYIAPLVRTEAIALAFPQCKAANCVDALAHNGGAWTSAFLVETGKVLPHVVGDVVLLGARQCAAIVIDA